MCVFSACTMVLSDDRGVWYRGDGKLYHDLVFYSLDLIIPGIVVLGGESFSVVF